VVKKIIFEFFEDFLNIFKDIKKSDRWHFRFFLQFSSKDFEVVGKCVESKTNLHSVLLLQFKILLPEGVDTIDHGLDKLNLGVAQAMFVGNVVGVTGLATRFAAGTTGLQAKSFAPLLQLVNRILGPAGQVNVDGGTHASAQVGGARVNVTELGGEQEVLARFSLDGVTDSLDASGETLEDSLDITSLLHGDNTELILLVDPDQEGLVGVVEDTTALGPVTLHTSDLQVGVTRHEEEMVIDELLAGGLVHAGQRVVAASQIAGQLGEGVLHEGLDVDTLLLGDSGGKTESLDGAADTDSARVDRYISLNIASDLGGVHVRGVLKVSRESMVLADEGVEDISEVNIGVLITSIDTAMLVVEFNGAGNSLGQGELRGLGDNLVELVPFFFSHVLGNQGVLGLDFGERSHGLFCFNK
jgi:hypothetical protein